MGKLIQLRPARPRWGPEDAVAELSDDGIAAACATGDRVAQGLVFERHADDVHRFIARMRGSDAEAVDDLVQATFLAAFASAHRFRGPKLRSWLFGIAANVMRTHVRKEVARKRATTTLAERTTDTVRPPDADLVRLREAIAELPPKLREVLVLVDLEGELGSDAAVALGIPQGTLWRRLSEARAHLRATLGGAP